MKKHIIFALVALLPIASFAEPTEQEITPKYNVNLFESCSVLEETDLHVIYQCPTDIEWVVELKQNEPNAMFQRAPDTEEAWELVMNDTEHDYVEVSFADIDYQICEPEQTAVRVKIKNPVIRDEPSNDNLWAFAGCK